MPHWCGRMGANECAIWQNQFQRTKCTFVRRFAAGYKVHECYAGGSDTTTVTTRIDPALNLFGHLRIVNRHLLAFNDDPDLDRNGFFSHSIVVEKRLSIICSIRNGVDAFTASRLALIEDDVQRCAIDI